MPDIIEKDASYYRTIRAQLLELADFAQFFCRATPCNEHTRTSHRTCTHLDVALHDIADASEVLANLLQDQTNFLSPCLADEIEIHRLRASEFDVHRAAADPYYAGSIEEKASWLAAAAKELWALALAEEKRASAQKRYADQRERWEKFTAQGPKHYAVHKRGSSSFAMGHYHIIERAAGPEHVRLCPINAGWDVIVTYEQLFEEFFIVEG